AGSRRDRPDGLPLPEWYLGRRAARPLRARGGDGGGRESLDRDRQDGAHVQMTRSSDHGTRSRASVLTRAGVWLGAMALFVLSASSCMPEKNALTLLNETQAELR